MFIMQKMIKYIFEELVMSILELSLLKENKWDPERHCETCVCVCVFQQISQNIISLALVVYELGVLQLRH